MGTSLNTDSLKVTIMKTCKSTSRLGPAGLSLGWDCISEHATSIRTNKTEILATSPGIALYCKLQKGMQISTCYHGIPTAGVVARSEWAYFLLLHATPQRAVKALPQYFLLGPVSLQPCMAVLSGQ